MGFLGGLGAIASLGSALFGGGSKSGKPQQTMQQSGWQTLPGQVQNAYLQNYLPQVMQYGSQRPNQYTQQAIEGYGGGLAGLMQQLPQYKQIFDQNTTQPTLDEIQRQVDIQKNALRAQGARSGLGSLLNSNMAIQLSAMQNNADRLKAQQLADFNRENTLQALNLRGQTLSELMAAGDQDYNRLGKFASLLGAFPGGSTATSTGPTMPRANTWDKIAGTINAAPALFNQFGF